MIEPIPPRTPLKLELPVKLETKFETTVVIEERKDSKLPKSRFSFNDVKKSPILAVILSSIFPKSFSPLAPRSLATASPTVPRIFLKMLNTEKMPENVRFNLSAVSSPIFSLDVKLSSAEVILTSRSAVIGGKILSNASLIGITTDSTASQIFQIESIKSVRPPASFQLSRISFLISAPPAKTSYIRLASSVHKSVASSALPNISSNVFIQPVLTASFTDSIASPKVRAF